MNPIQKAVGILLIITAAVAMPAAADIVVEAVGSVAAEAGLHPGEILTSWSGADSRQGRFEHWWELELMVYTELPRGPIRLARASGEPITLPSRKLKIAARPMLPAEVAESFAHGLASLENPTAADLDALVEALGPEADTRLWARVRQAGSLADSGGLAAAVETYSLAAGLAPPPFSAELLRRQGLLLRRLRRFDEAEAAFDRGIEIWRAHEAPGLGLSILLSSQGDLQGALQELERSRKLNQEACNIRRRHAPESWFLGSCLNNLGITAARRNDFATSEALFLEALDLTRAQGGAGEKMLANLGNIARLRGDFDRAESYTEQALEIYRERGATLDVAAKTINLANIAGDSGDHERAILLYGKALGLAKEVGGDPEHVGAVLLNRGKVYRLAGEFEAAERDLQEAKQLFGFESPTTSSEATIVGLLGEIALERGQYEKAVGLLQTTLDVWSRRRPDSSNEAVAASALGRAWLGRGDKERAEDHFRRSIEAIEKQQARAGGGDRGLVAFRSKFAGLYRAYVEFLLEQGRPDEAFELYERSRAQGLRALLDGRDLVFAVDETIERQRRQLGTRIQSAYRSISRLPLDAADDRQELRLELERLHADRDALSQRLQAASPRLAAAEAPPALGLAAIRKSLRGGTLVLAYSLGPKSSTLFVIDRDKGLETFELPIGARDLADEIEHWAELVVSPRPRRELETRSRFLTELLLGPAAARIAEADLVVIVPDQSLHRLSFGALFDPGDSGRYFIEAIPLAQEVSVSVFVGWSSLAPPDNPPSRVAIFGDPSSSASAVARFRRDLGRLPASRSEASSVQKVYGDSAVVYLDDSATEAAARSELAEAGITHFACHAVIDEKLPLDSALVLASEEGGGLLQAWEIAEQLEVASDLVVLSGCETAGGGGRSGEGIVGLVRAFQIAGASSVVASLWRIGDESTSALMARFYGHLNAGASRAEALRAAQVELITGKVEVERDGETVLLDASSPRHWAPFVLLGRD